MRRSVVLVLGLVLGCFSDPPPASGGDDDSTGNATTTTTSTSTLSTGEETTSSTSDIPESSEGSTWGIDTGSSSESGSADTTGAPEPECGCGGAQAVFCEEFDGFDDGFPEWSVPSGSAPPAQTDGPCGPAFRGQIEKGQEYAVIARAVVVPLDAGSVILRGRLRIEPGCATEGRHRLLQARVDQGSPPQFVYAAEYALDPDGTTHVLQTTPVPPADDDELEAPEEGTWVEFEFGLLGLAAEGPPGLEVTVDGETLMLERPPLGGQQSQFTVVLGPFSPSAPEVAGCAVDFDDVHVVID